MLAEREEYFMAVHEKPAERLIRDQPVFLSAPEASDLERSSS